LFPPKSKQVSVLAGGVGAAKFIRGLVRVIPPEHLTVVVNTGDDEMFFGLHVSPDVDTVMYTLAGEVHPGQGWGLRDESFRVLEALTRFYGKPWFGLGDRDLATHLYRTDQLRAGKKLSDLTADISKRFGVKSRILPMSDDRVRTFVKIRGRDAMPFQEYFVKGRARGLVEKIELRGIEEARPLPSVIDGIRTSATIILAPSNPFVSLGPIFGLRGVRDALASARDRVVAISPIVGGKTIKGPADKMLRGLGLEVSALGIARLYKDIVGTFVLDQVDRNYVEPIRELGMRVVATDTIMTTPAKSARLAGIIMRTIMKDSSRLSYRVI
jgi:LPPG:FO 2-phospho-L-lactate transferase